MIRQRIREFRAFHTKSHRAYKKRAAATDKGIMLRRKAKALYHDGEFMMPYDWRRKYAFSGMGDPKWSMMWNGQNWSRPHHSVLGKYALFQAGDRYSPFMQLCRWILGEGIVLK